MKRSEINTIIREAEAFIRTFQFLLPPFAGWEPDRWQRDATATAELRRAGLGWDVTDFGLGDFPRKGLTLFTLRNGNAAHLSRGHGMLYAEKLLVVRRDQVTLAHHHKLKTEDIIVRGGAPLAVQLHALDSAGGMDHQSPVTVQMDGVAHEFEPGGIAVVEPGASITLSPGCVHSFWGHEGDCLAGEVSTVNDDATDNFFFEPTARFPQIDEDEPPYRCIVPDYLG